MSCCSYSTSSGHAVRKFSSSSVTLPRSRCSFSAASCHWGGGTGYRGLGSFSSRSPDATVCSRPRTVVERCSPLRRGYGFGAADTGFGYRGAGFGYGVGGVCRPCTITPISINKQLLQLLRLGLDPNMQRVKDQEKEQIKTLNNKSACSIEKVRFLEQQNKVLETKWNFLQGQNHCRSIITPMLEAHTGNLKKELEAQGCNRAQLETDLKAAQQVLETTRKCPRTNAASGRAARDVDWFSLNKAELEAKAESLKEEAEFLRTFYEELEELRVTAGRSADSLRETKPETAELTQTVQRLNGGVRSAKAQRHRLEAAAADTEQCGEMTAKDAKHKLSELETALQQTKADLAQQLHEYQELMNIRLALDVKIVTYRKMLEGEESRLCAEERFATNTGKLREIFTFYQAEASSASFPRNS